MPKQFRLLRGRPVLWWSLKAFREENPETRLILVLPEDFISWWKDLFSSLPEEDRIEHEVTSGGPSRGESVKNGLALIPDGNPGEESLVAIHDAARPMVDSRLISLGWDTARQYGAGIPVAPVVDSLRLMRPDGLTEAVNRDQYRAVQTPQVFKTSVIKAAYEKAGDKTFTDDAAVAENAGQYIACFEGSPDNMKITNPTDLAITEVLMEWRNVDGIE